MNDAAIGHHRSSITSAVFIDRLTDRLTKQSVYWLVGRMKEVVCRSSEPLLVVSRIRHSISNG